MIGIFFGIGDYGGVYVWMKGQVLFVVINIYDVVYDQGCRYFVYIGDIIDDDVQIYDGIKV